MSNKATSTSQLGAFNAGASKKSSTAVAERSVINKEETATGHQANNQPIYKGQTRMCPEAETVPSINRVAPRP